MAPAQPWPDSAVMILDTESKAVKQMTNVICSLQGCKYKWGIAEKIVASPLSIRGLNEAAELMASSVHQRMLHLS